jgi:hypothetical protein
MAAPAKKTHTATMVELIKFRFLDIISFSFLIKKETLMLFIQPPRHQARKIK